MIVHTCRLCGRELFLLFSLNPKCNVWLWAAEELPHVVSLALSHWNLTYKHVVARLMALHICYGPFNKTCLYFYIVLYICLHGSFLLVPLQSTFVTKLGILFRDLHFYCFSGKGQGKDERQRKGAQWKRQGEAQKQWTCICHCNDDGYPNMQKLRQTFHQKIRLCMSR